MTEEEETPASTTTIPNGQEEEQGVAATDVADTSENVRIGSISSARFNILSTMVGGGCLSLPLAFQQSGNALIGPLMLLVTGVITNFCFQRLVQTSRAINPPHTVTPGKDTFESITSEAFGPTANVVSMGLVVLMCFFGTVGYSVLLRDMVEPLNDWILAATKLAATSSAVTLWFHKNFTMFLVIVLVTPFCTLRRLTALKDCGALSMVSLLILGGCIVIRSVQCQLGVGGDDNEFFKMLDDEPWYSHLKLFPDSWHDLLNALPLYISCFVCHYNILPVHNELQNPTEERVNKWLSTTTWFAVGLYMVMGFAGSAYAHCTPTGKVQGNILLDFDEHDPLLMVGRMCLAVTITLAFPMLVIPGRDIVVRSVILPRMQQMQTNASGAIETSVEEELAEPLLNDEQEEISGDDNNDETSNDKISFLMLLSISITLFWSAAALASLVSSIDVVWDLLGSSLSILMSYLIPAGTYLVITKQSEEDTTESNDDEPTSYGKKASRVACWLLLVGSVPLMIVSTANAVYNTFFLKD